MRGHMYRQEHTDRLWFVLDKRDRYYQAESEFDARETLSGNPDAVAVVYRDVTYGPMVEVTR